MSDDHFLDADTYIQSQRSPLLEAVKPNFASSETPPPLVDHSSSDESDEVEGEGGDRPARSRRSERNLHQQPIESDPVLLSQLAPNCPDIAHQSLNDTLDSSSEAEAVQEEDINASLAEHEMIDHQHIQNVTKFADQNPKRLAIEALNASQKLRALTTAADGDFAMIDTLERATQIKDHCATHPVTNGFHFFTQNGHSNPHPKSLRPAASLSSAKKEFDVRPPPRLPPITTDHPNSKKEHNYDEKESIATSPTLSKFAINPINPDPEHTLPAMQKSPPRSTSNGCPEHRQTLPSLTTALSMNETGGAPFTGHSPSLTRPSPGQMSHFGPSPSSYSQPSPHNAMSPPGLPTHPQYWRSNTRDGSISTPSDHASASTSTSATASTPASSILGQSPASYTTPTGSMPEQMRQDSQDDAIISPGSDGQMPNGVGITNGAVAAHCFQCNVPGCTAAPFQTQYLLNSHMNVHSNTRPHFCSVRNCARGPGGQGFKRKNEMIRHGLVHTSPGYMCPFCPDQQHKYPRPDNLQRHVRVHHVDKDRDDPALREVLAQRPEGGNRGRRRRQGSS